jgi:hypothetical protein
MNPDVLAVRFTRPASNECLGFWGLAMLHDEAIPSVIIFHK